MNLPAGHARGEVRAFETAANSAVANRQLGSRDVRDSCIINRQGANLPRLRHEAPHEGGVEVDPRRNGVAIDDGRRRLHDKRNVARAGMLDCERLRVEDKRILSANHFSL